MLSTFFKRWISSVNGVENVPKYGGIVLASNHESFFDFLLLSSALKRDVSFLAAEKFFKSKTWRPLMILSGQIPINRYTTVYQGEAISRAIGLLRNGNIVGIFPEGSRSDDGELRKAYTGVARLALTAKVPIIPVGMVGTFEILPKDGKFPKLRKCHINIGEPIYLDPYFGREYENHILRKLTDHVMHKISDLSKERYIHAKRNVPKLLNEMHSEKKVVFFDVDRTIVDDQTQKMFVNYLDSKHYIAKWLVIKLLFLFILYKFHLLPKVDNVRKNTYKIINGWNVEDLKKISNEFFNEVIVKHIYKEAFDKIVEHKNSGDIVILFSASWDFLIEPLRSYLDVPYIIATRLKSKDGKFNGELLSGAVYGKNKTILAQRFLEKCNINRLHSIAYGDHYSDLPLLEFVNHPVVVNPDARLKRIAQKRSWLINEWRELNGN